MNWIWLTFALLVILVVYVSYHLVLNGKATMYYNSFPPKNIEEEKTYYGAALTTGYMSSILIMLIGIIASIFLWI